MNAWLPMVMRLSSSGEGELDEGGAFSEGASGDGGEAGFLFLAGFIFLARSEKNSTTCPTSAASRFGRRPVYLPKEVGYCANNPVGTVTV